MKAIISIYIYMLFTPLLSMGQNHPPPDSLKGIYKGMYSITHGFDTVPTVVGQDSEYVYFLDTNTCTINYSGRLTFSNDNFETDSSYCIHNNSETRFYSHDSLYILHIYATTPMPNSYVYVRFYGKRIPGSWIMGIYDEIENKIHISPNPFSEKLKLENLELKEFNLKIVDVFGKDVFGKYITKSEELDLSFLSAGVYFVRLQNDKGEGFAKKVVKM